MSNFTSGKIKLMNCDCMDYMKSLPDNAFELAIVDPPYGIDAANMTLGKGSGIDKGAIIRKNWDKETPKEDYFYELKRVSRNQIIWGGNYFLDYLGATRCFLMWDKIDYNSDFASHEVAWTSFDKNTKCFRRARSAQGDNSSINKIHPTQKPVKLYDWLLANYAKEGDRILDTHLGSGSSAIAAHYGGFEFVGMELDSDYYEAAVKRFQDQTSQLDIFGGAA